MLSGVDSTRCRVYVIDSNDKNNSEYRQDGYLPMVKTKVRTTSGY